MEADVAAAAPNGAVAAAAANGAAAVPANGAAAVPASGAAAAAAAYSAVDEEFDEAGGAVSSDPSELRHFFFKI